MSRCEHERLARAKRARGASPADGSPLGRRPPDNAATVARSRLLDHDLSAAATPDRAPLSRNAGGSSAYPGVMLTTRHVQRPRDREREATVEARPLNRRRAAPPREVARMASSKFEQSLDLSPLS